MKRVHMYVATNKQFKVTEFNHGVEKKRKNNQGSFISMQRYNM